MTGIAEYNFPAFHAAAAAWRAAGWEVVNPAESFGGKTDLPYREYVRSDIALLKTVDAIVLLPGWDGATARGSVWEWGMAVDLGLLVYESQPVVSPPPMRAPETILQEAQRLVHGARGADYGHPIVDYRATGRMWGAILERHLGAIVPDIDPGICCLMMVAVKLSREAGKHKRDNNTDGAGYFECAQMIRERQGTP
jgi:hypothetical protein